MGEYSLEYQRGGISFLGVRSSKQLPFFSCFLDKINLKLEMCGSAGHWLRLAFMFSNSFRKIIHKLKAELMNYMCYHLSFMSETEPYKVDT